VPSLSIIFQSTPSFRTPYPTSSGTSGSGPSSSPAEFGTSLRWLFDCREDVAEPAIDDTEGEREGDGGGNALDGSRDIGRNDLDGVDLPRIALIRSL
jgi:hypothetical protein